MNVSESPPALVQASQTGDCFKAALAYHQQGLSILPLKGKRPALSSWTEFQSRIATEDEIKQWQRDDLLQNVGVVCGKVSNNLVVIDFDGLAAYSAFTTLFPALAETFTARTGSSQGMHVYLYVDTLPATTKAMDNPHRQHRTTREWQPGCRVTLPSPGDQEGLPGQAGTGHQAGS
jgi:hypothetical protein